MRNPGNGRTLRPLVIAGIVGGFAEIIWITLYALFTSLSALEVSRQVVASVAPSVAATAFAPALGVGIHMVLSVALAFALGAVMRLPFAAKSAPWLSVVYTVAMLVVVWAVNFFIVLPRLNPTFVTLMPYSVTFISKLLFGLAVGWSLYYFHARPQLQTRERAILLLTYGGATAGGNR